MLTVWLMNSERFLIRKQIIDVDFSQCAAYEPCKIASQSRRAKNGKEVQCMEYILLH